SSCTRSISSSVQISVAMGVRPAGSSSRNDTSRFAKRLIAKLLGIGVAVIISRFAFGPNAFTFARSKTPNRCCSSITPSASLRIRSEHRLDFTVRETAQNLLASCTRHAPRKQRAPYIKPPGHAREAAPVLLREQFRRRHHRRLMPAFDRPDHRPERNNRFAAANVAHQHPVHLIRPRKVGADFLYRARLRSGQLERQLIRHPLAQVARSIER